MRTEADFSNGEDGVGVDLRGRELLLWWPWPGSFKIDWRCSCCCPRAKWKALASGRAKSLRNMTISLTVEPLKMRLPCKMGAAGLTASLSKCHNSGIDPFQSNM